MKQVYPAEFMVRKNNVVLMTDANTGTRFFAPASDPQPGEYIFRYPPRTGLAFKAGDLVVDKETETRYRVWEIAVQRPNSASGRVRLVKV